MKTYDFPDWFSIDAYAATARLDFQGWKQQLGSRIYLKMLLDIGSNEEFDLHFAKTSESPFFDLGFDVNYAADRAVYALTYGAVSSLLQPLPPGIHAHANCDEAYEKATNSPSGMYLHLTVDLHASEAEIMSDFRSLIGPALARTKTGRKAGITQKVIESWHQFQILPYLDLHLWSIRHGTKLPSHTALAVELFPEGREDKDTIRNSTIPKALMALKMPTLRQLALAR